MIVHVSVPGRLSKLSIVKMELSAALPVAENFHEDVALRAASVSAHAEGTVENEKASAEDKLSAVKSVVRARAAEEDAGKAYSALQKKLSRVEDTIEGYKLCTAQSVNTFADKMTDGERKLFSGLAKRLRDIRTNSTLSAKAKKQETENVWGEMKKHAKACKLPLDQILAGVK